MKIRNYPDTRAPLTIKEPTAYWDYPPHPLPVHRFPKSGKPALRHLLTLTVLTTRVSEKEMMMPGHFNRRRPVARARQLFAYLAKTFTDKSFPEISRKLNLRDHTTSYYGVLSLVFWRQVDRKLDELITRVEAYVQEQYPECSARDLQAQYMTQALARFGGQARLDELRRQADARGDHLRDNEERKIQCSGVD